MTKHWGETHHGAKQLRLDFWLTVGWDGKNRPSVRVTANHPALARTERAINLRVNLPMALFTSPVITADINVAAPEQAVQIDASAIAEAVKSAIGMDVDITVAHPEEPS